MVWARIDDQYPDHPKVTGLSDPAFRLHISAIAYASRYLTDGFVPLGQVRKLLPFSDDPSAVCDELVEAGLFEPADKGYVVHDYLSYNPSRAEIEEKRESDRRRKRGQTDGGAPPAGFQTESTRNPIAPVPVPVPEPEENEPPSPRATRSEIAQVAEILTSAPYVGDDLLAVEIAVQRAYALVPQFNPRDGPFLAEQFAGWRGYRKRPPENWYLAWLKWLKKERDDAGNRAQTTPNGVRTPPATHNVHGRFAPSDDFDAAVRARQGAAAARDGPAGNPVAHRPDSG